MSTTGPQTIVISEGEQAHLERSARIQTWLVTHLAEKLEIAPENIDAKDPFDRYGLDSFAAVNLVGELEDWLDCELSPTLPYEYPTVESLTRYLAELQSQRVVS